MEMGDYYIRTIHLQATQTKREQKAKPTQSRKENIMKEKIKATMKIYPVNEVKHNERWADRHSKRAITIRIGNAEERPNEETANKGFEILHNMGYGAIDYNTHRKVVDVDLMYEEQRLLMEYFDLKLVL